LTPQLEKAKISNIEKLSVLIALEAADKEYANKSMLENRAAFLSRPFTNRILQLKNIEPLLKDLFTYERGKPPHITLKGKKELYNPKNRDLILLILGKTMEDLGSQFIGYGKFVQDLTQKQNEKISLEEFETLLRQIYVKLEDLEPRLHGAIPLDLVKTQLNEKITLSNDTINEYLLELEKQRIIDLQIAYDASAVKKPEYGIYIPNRGLVYFVIYRSKGRLEYEQ